MNDRDTLDLIEDPVHQNLLEAVPGMWDIPKTRLGP